MGGRPNGQTNTEVQNNNPAVTILNSRSDGDFSWDRHLMINRGRCTAGVRRKIRININIALPTHPLGRPQKVQTSTERMY